MRSAPPLWKRPKARLFLTVAAVWLIALVVLALAWRVLLPFLLAALLAYVIDPIITGMSRDRVGWWAVPRWAAVLAVYAVIGAALWLMAVSIVPQVYGEAVRGLTQLRDFLGSLTPDKLHGWAGTIDAYLQRHGIPVDVLAEGPEQSGRVSLDLEAGFAEALHAGSNWLKGQVGSVVTLSRAVVSYTLETLVFTILLLMLTAFFSMDGPRILAFVESLVPRDWRDDLRRMLQGIDAGLAGVVRGQVTIMLINGTLTLVGLLLLRIPFGFALGALATILYVVPIFGTILSSVPIVLLGLTVSFSTGVLALAWILAIHALEAYFLNPKIMGDAAKIHPVLIVLALLIGEHHFGLVGALLAVPFASIVAAIFKFLHRKALALDDEVAGTSPPTARPTLEPGPIQPQP
jgi:predicted PurR-regulated permease PerM